MVLQLNLEKMDVLISELLEHKDEDYFFENNLIEIQRLKAIGVPYIEIKKIAKKYKRNTALITELKQSNYYEAKLLYYFLSKNISVTEKDIDAQFEFLENDFIIDKFLNYLVFPSGYCEIKLQNWIDSKIVLEQKLAYLLISEMAKSEKFTNFNFEFYLDKIKDNILYAENEVKIAMNQAIISIGIHSDKLHGKTLQMAKAIGKLRCVRTKLILKCNDAFTLLNSAKTRAKFTVEF
ncbi:MAG: DNA alkylation repair protein [Bacteroidota bacterium]